MFDLVEKHGVGLPQVKKVTVSLPKTIYDMHGIFPRYKGKFEALLSIHYVVGVILDDKTLTIVNVLPEKAWKAERIRGSISLPEAEIETRAASLLPDRDAEIAVYCASPT